MHLLLSESLSFTPTTVPHPAQVVLPRSFDATGCSQTCGRLSRQPDKYPAGKGKKAGKKKAAGKAKGSTPAAPAAPKQSIGKTSKPTDAATCSALTVHSLTDKVLELYPDMDGAGDSLGLHLLI